MRAESVDFSPNHFIHHAGVGLDDLDDLIGDVLVRIIGNGDAEVAVLVHLHGGIDRLEQTLFVDAGEDEASFVERLGAFGARSDTNSGERFTDAREERAFLGKCSAVGHHREGVHLQTVIVMEAQRFMLYDAFVQHKSACLQALFGTRMAGIEDRKIILLSHFIDRREQAREILFGIDVLLTMSREKNVFAFL